MKKLINIAFYTSFSFIPLSFLFRILGLPGYSLFMLTGLLCITTYFIAKSINNFLKKGNIQVSILFILIGLMSTTLCLRYFHWAFWDIPGFIILPLFIIFSSLNLFNNKTRTILNGKAISTIILFLIMSVPLFLTFDNSPRKYIPDEWLPQNINNTEYRNENWAWFLDKKTGKGNWIPIGTKNTLDEGKYTLFFSNGKIREIGKIKNGKNIDTTFIYDINEMLIKYTLIGSGANHYYYINEGKYSAYYKTGELLEKGIVKDHKQSDNWTNYYKSGQILMKNYTIGNASIKIDYYENSQIKDSIIYTNGEKNGLASFWYKNGKLRELTEWKNGKQDGLYIFYFENGNIKEKTLWVGGIRDGETTLWYENGQMLQRGFNKNGYSNGFLEQWYQNGNLQVQGNFLKNEKDGKFVNYFENGKVQQTGNFISDKPNGLVKSYTENGNLISIANYSYGQLNGEVKLFDESGSLDQIDIYENGKFIKTK